MMKTIEHLIDLAEKTTKEKVYKRLGNHALELDSDGARFIYFDTVVCLVNFSTKICRIDNGGWATSSTNRTINDYARYWNMMGYHIVYSPRTAELGVKCNIITPEQAHKIRINGTKKYIA